MKYRKMGKSGVELSVIGVGTWAYGGGNWAYSWGPQDDDESIEAIRHAVSCGVNWIDTAPVYGLGHAETVTAKALNGMRNKVLISTKCSIVWDDKNEITVNLSRDSIMRECEQSLRRLGTDHIDIYHIHNPANDSELDGAWKAVNDLKKQGKIRFAAISNFTIAQLERLHAEFPVDTVQPPYNLLNRGIEAEILPFCRNNSIGVITYGPMARGLLSGRFSKERVDSLADDDHRKRDDAFKGENLEKALALVGRMKKIASDLGITVPQIAVAWVLKNQTVTGAICGARNVSQIDELLDAADCDIKDVEL